MTNPEIVVNFEDPLPEIVATFDDSIPETVANFDAPLPEIVVSIDSLLPEIVVSFEELLSPVEVVFSDTAVPGAEGPPGIQGEPGVQGDQGNQGPPGSIINASYIHTQNAVSADWEIEHNLGFQPAITVYDSGGTQVEGDVERIDNNNIHIHFSSAFSGQAFLS